MLRYTSQPFCGSGCKEKSKRPFFRGCFDGMMIPVLLLRQGWLTPWHRLARHFTLCRTEWFWHAWGLTTQKRGIWLMRIPGRVVRQHIYWHLLSFTIFGCRSCFPVTCLPQIFHPTWMLLHVSVCAKVAQLESNRERQENMATKKNMSHKPDPGHCCWFSTSPNCGLPLDILFPGQHYFYQRR